MIVAVNGCSHNNAGVEIRERLAFSPSQAQAALDRWRERFPATEAVLISTCNRIEFYTAAEDPAQCPSRTEIVAFLAGCHGLEPVDVMHDLFERQGEDAVRHLFTVAASLDSMVLGESQILAQVKQAYQVAADRQSAGPLTHGIFQSALRVAKRVATETSIQQKRVSIPSVAVADFAKGIFEHFRDKRVLVIGAGEMGEETVTYFREEGASDITIVNRALPRAQELADRWNGRAATWEELDECLAFADVVVSTTGATEPIVTAERFLPIHRHRQGRLLILDLAIPRDFDPEVAAFSEVFLYNIDDLRKVCEQNRAERGRELKVAMSIVEDETARFMADLNHRATSPIIRRLKQDWQRIEEDELARLFARVPNLDEKTQAEVRKAFDRLVNKLLHPPLESLRDEAKSGVPHGLLHALKVLFRIQD